VKEVKNDSLGFEKFLVDELIVSLLSQLAGGYVRLLVKARKENLPEHTVRKYRTRFNEVGKAKITLHSLTYPQKVEKINTYKTELKEVLAQEKAV
jgi:hypothetical protein